MEARLLVPGLAVCLGSKGDLSVRSAPTPVVTKIAPSLPPVPLVVASSPLAAPLAPVLPPPVLPAAASQAPLLQQTLVVLHQLAHLVGELEGLEIFHNLENLSNLLESGCSADILLNIFCGFSGNNE